jgi:tetratricopeptide (TPR) repeat protein
MNREPIRIQSTLSRFFVKAVPCLTLAMVCMAPAMAAPSHTAAEGTTRPCTTDLASIFRKGQAALQANQLREAEESFRAVIACDPKSASAFVNLGVVEMRRKQWAEALAYLRRAERIAPAMEGIRLNIGLVYYREGNYRAAIPMLRSVVEKTPTEQARYLLGLCYFFTGDYKPALAALEQNWEQQSGDLIYLYVVGIAAEQSGSRQVSDRAFSQLLQIGGDSPEFHLLKGKAYLNRAQPEDAIPELEKAASVNPKLPFVHFNLGWAYAKKRDYERARREFLDDISLEPEIPYNYEQLGAMDLYLGNYADAERYYRQALERDARLPNSLYGLGKIYDHQNRPADALATWQKAEQLAPESVTIHNALGRLLHRMGKSADANREFATINQLEQKQHADELANPQLPAPEVKAER